MAGTRAQVPFHRLAAGLRVALALVCAGLCECTAPAASPGQDVVGTGDGIAAKDVVDVTSTPDAADDVTAKDVPDVAGAPDVVDAAEVADPGDGLDADVACLPHHVPRMKGDVVVDPCGCCEIKPDCSGYFGGSPWGDQCYMTYDEAPPCYETYDEKGCRVLACSGSCLPSGKSDAVDSGD